MFPSRHTKVDKLMSRCESRPTGMWYFLFLQFFPYPCAHFIIPWFTSSLVHWINKPCTWHSSGARLLGVSRFYRHIAPLEQRDIYPSSVGNNDRCSLQPVCRNRLLGIVLVHLCWVSRFLFNPTYDTGGLSIDNNSGKITQITHRIRHFRCEKGRGQMGLRPLIILS